MNYGETLAYWYLRLNGFFPLPNFVLHRPQEGRGYNADADLLAIRFPYVCEETGGHADDWDNARFAEWRLNHDENAICLVAEVKAGRYKKSAIKRAFGRDRLNYVLRRFGIIESGRVPNIVGELEQCSMVVVDDITFAKLLIDEPRLRPGPGEEPAIALPPVLRLTINEAKEFIVDRMRACQDEKNAARMFFPSDLIQYIAWENGVEVEVPDVEELPADM